MRRASRVAATLACLAADAPRARAAAFDRARLAGACRARRWSASAPSDVARDPATAASAGAARAGDLHFRDPPPRPPHRRVVVTGIGLVTPLGAGTARTWTALMAGESGVRAIGPDDVPEGPDGYDQLSVRVAAVVPRRNGSTNPDEPFDLAEWCASPSVAPFAGYALCAAAEATADAGIVATAKSSSSASNSETSGTSVDPNRCGVSIGSGMGHVSDVTHAGRLLERNKLKKKLSPFFVPRVLCNAAAGQVSMAHDFRGPNRATATACAAGAHAVGDAFRAVQRGEADVMLAGGTESCVDAATIAGFARARALADPEALGLREDGGTDATTTRKRKNTYASACRPFDPTRSGFVVGEGAGVLVVECLEHARARGVQKIYAEIRGFGQSSDAFHVTQPPSDGAGAARAMRAALADAGFSPHDVDYVNAHATGTRAGDEAECNALLDVFGSRFADGKMAVSSTKGAVGHLLGAAGAVEAAFAALSLFHAETPPTLHLTPRGDEASVVTETYDSDSTSQKKSPNSFSVQSASERGPGARRWEALARRARRDDQLVRVRRHERQPRVRQGAASARSGRRASSMKVARISFTSPQTNSKVRALMFW
jgi:3-oxoacyl-[acyl-carrier-protein] synthase II